MEIAGETIAIRAHCIREIVDGLVGEVSTEHRADAIKLNGNVGRSRCVAHALFQVSAGSFELLIGSGFLELGECGDARGHCQRITAECARLVNRSEWREHFHDLVAPAECTDRQASTDDFSEATQIRINREELLCAAQREAETCHYFIEDEERIVCVADMAEEFEETRAR